MGSSGGGSVGREGPRASPRATPSPSSSSSRSPLHGAHRRAAARAPNPRANPVLSRVMWRLLGTLARLLWCALTWIAPRRKPEAAPGSTSPTPGRDARSSSSSPHPTNNEVPAAGGVLARHGVAHFVG
eukprot:CAMPEP_0180390862 /NCGR_PEP_ID=MMETSP0989-20121125/32248_1 /TAXON_ID=697907 /ORGANISM="non described non described, Strain CCMP2293" /LENGTH=127 /DNA_ID=CAMNT_0022392319 /DNA_START=224 /DNA_END=605 /DNA_ORIENTATION=-